MKKKRKKTLYQDNYKDVYTPTPNSSDTIESGLVIEPNYRFVNDDKVEETQKI